MTTSSTNGPSSSRLTRKEQRTVVRQTLISIGVAIILVVAFIFVIIPGVIRLTLAFLGSGTSFVATDDVPPQVPVLAAPVPATFSAQVDISGFGEAKSKITFVVNGSEYQDVTASDDGSFGLSLPLTEGENSLTVYAKDEAGNESAESKKYMIVFDAQAPELVITEPQPDQQIELRKNQLTTIRGTTEPGSRVFVNGRLASVQTDGAFSLTYQLQEGENILKIEATDRAGNKTEQELKVFFRL